ncbi:hypothetical protein CPB84DRAFT_1753588 [Gymnopilus junonius]|uniref:Uncharacterized protein n=1 Tax=Gymnopilus junonius TaxID=109634 RepID=A0A9P5N7N6_GYMJU|nr:hypothetical protein CPB84DRAFT_1753588 [Gymnopilus junonius]
MANATVHHDRAHGQSALETVKEEEVEVSKNALLESTTLRTKRLRELSVKSDNNPCTLKDLEAHPLYDEAEFMAQYIAGHFTDQVQDESQMSTFDSQWCDRQDAKEAVHRGEAIVKYLNEKIAVSASASPARQDPSTSPTHVLSSQLVPSTPTPSSKYAALKTSAGQPMAMWTPNLSRDVLSAPSRFVVSDGRPAPRLQWTPVSQWLPFSESSPQASAAEDDEDSIDSQPSLSHAEAEEELELAGKILLRAEENLIEARLRYARAYVYTLSL